MSPLEFVTLTDINTYFMSRK